VGDSTNDGSPVRAPRTRRRTTRRSTSTGPLTAGHTRKREWTMGSVIKKRRKRMAKKKHRKLLRKTRHQRRNKK